MSRIKKALFGLGALALVLGLSGTIASSANAYRVDPAVKGPNYSEERHSAMEKALEANDYTAWQKLMQNRGRVTQVVNKDNFAKFAEAHRLAEKGDLEGARKIRQELGLGLKNGSGQGAMGGFGRGLGRGNCIN